MTEVELAQKVIEWIEGPWEVYQEVVCPYGVADIVAVKRPIVWCIEVKRTMTFKLIEQARNRLSCSHFVSVATPVSRNRSHVVSDILRYYGIGSITVNKHGIVREQTSPRMNRRQNAKALLGTLRDEQKTWAKAGSKGGYWTPFRGTCVRALRLISSNGPMTIKELMSKLQHHYHSPQSARAAFPRLIRDGVVPGLRLDETKRPYMIRPAEK